MLDFIAIGDLHLDGLNFLGADANKYILSCVEQAEKYAVRHKIEHIFYLGDISDKPKLSYDAHTLLMEQWLKYPFIHRWVILGNHDYGHLGRHSLEIMKCAFKDSHIHIIDMPERVVLEGVPVNFLPYPYPNLSCDFSLRNSINVSHFEIAGAQRDNNTESNSRQTVPDGTYWIMGHLHTPQDVGRVHYTGTLFQKNFGETLPKYFSRIQAKLLEPTKAGEPVLKIRKKRIKSNPSFTLTNLDISKRSDLKNVPYEENCFYKLFLSAGVTLPLDFLAQHPNVIKVQGYKTKQEREALLTDSVILTQDTDEIDIANGLNDYIDTHAPHLTIEQKNRILTIFKEIKDTL